MAEKQGNIISAKRLFMNISHIFAFLVSTLSDMEKGVRIDRKETEGFFESKSLLDWGYQLKI